MKDNFEESTQGTKYCLQDSYFDYHVSKAQNKMRNFHSFEIFLSYFVTEIILKLGTIQGYNRFKEGSENWRVIINKCYFKKVNEEAMLKVAIGRI